MIIFIFQNRRKICSDFFEFFRTFFLQIDPKLADRAQIFLRSLVIFWIGLFLLRFYFQPLPNQSPDCSLLFPTTAQTRAQTVRFCFQPLPNHYSTRAQTRAQTVHLKFIGANFKALAIAQKIFLNIGKFSKFSFVHKLWTFFDSLNKFSQCFIMSYSA